MCRWRLTILANDKDTDGTIDPTTVAIVGAAKHGTTSINPTTGVVTYTPAANYTGTDTFTYKVKDNQGAYSNVATVLDGQASESAAAGHDDSATVKKNKSVAINVLANDRDSDGSINKATLLIVAATTTWHVEDRFKDRRRHLHAGQELHRLG